MFFHTHPCIAQHHSVVEFRNASHSRRTRLAVQENECHRKPQRKGLPFASSLNRPWGHGMWEQGQNKNQNLKASRGMTPAIDIMMYITWCKPPLTSHIFDVLCQSLPLCQEVRQKQLAGNLCVSGGSAGIRGQVPSRFLRLQVGLYDQGRSSMKQWSDVVSISWIVRGLLRGCKAFPWTLTQTIEQSLAPHDLWWCLPMLACFKIIQDISISNRYPKAEKGQAAMLQDTLQVALCLLIDFMASQPAPAGSCTAIPSARMGIYGDRQDTNWKICKTTLPESFRDFQT